MFDLILVMAGSGTRTSLRYNKNLYKIKGQPLFCYSIAVFNDISNCDKIIIVVNEKDYEKVKKSITPFPAEKLEIVLGGARRQDSVLNGLNICKSEYVLIHDGARPLINKKQVMAVYEGAKKVGCATLAVPARDTIYQIDKNNIKPLDRSKVWHIQTPQAIKRTMLMAAFNSISKHDTFTDEISLIMNYYDIYPEIIKGSHNNIKVTYDDDLKVVGSLLESRFK